MSRFDTESSCCDTDPALCIHSRTASEQKHSEDLAAAVRGEPTLGETEDVRRSSGSSEGSSSRRSVSSIKSVLETLVQTSSMNPAERLPIKLSPLPPVSSDSPSTFASQVFVSSLTTTSTLPVPREVSLPPPPKGNATEDRAKIIAAFAQPSSELFADVAWMTSDQLQKDRARERKAETSQRLQADADKRRVQLQRARTDYKPVDRSFSMASSRSAPGSSQKSRRGQETSGSSIEAQPDCPADIVDDPDLIALMAREREQRRAQRRQRKRQEVQLDHERTMRLKDFVLENPFQAPLVKPTQTGTGSPMEQTREGSEG